jgi:hypothetical protein
MNFQRGSYVDAMGSSLQGYLEATAHEVTAILGPQDPEAFDPDKTRNEWTLMFDDGHVATVYDYYHSPRHPDETFRWHVGGRTTIVVDRLSALLAEYRQEKSRVA